MTKLLEDEYRADLLKTRVGNNMVSKGRGKRDPKTSEPDVMVKPRFLFSVDFDFIRQVVGADMFIWMTLLRHERRLPIYDKH